MRFPESNRGAGFGTQAPDAVVDSLTRLQPLVEAHITPERIRRYLKALSEVPAPSTAASALRSPILRDLLSADGVLHEHNLHFNDNFGKTANTVILTGSDKPEKPLWYFAHLDTVSYLIQNKEGARYPLVPFGYHLIDNGTRSALAYRFDLERSEYYVVAVGSLESEAGKPYFQPESSVELRPGDRIVFTQAYEEDKETGDITAHTDNAGAVAALAVAAPVMARAGVEALLAFPDEEEGPQGSGNQVIGRGGTRIVNLLPPPELAIVSDVQQGGGAERTHTRGEIENTTRLGQGAVLAEFSSLGRGAVTPPHLYALARDLSLSLTHLGVRIQESNNAYTSRSDDVSVILKTPHVLLLGFPGFNRHFDLAEPKANLYDLVNLSKALVYFSVLRPRLNSLIESLTKGKS